MISEKPDKIIAGILLFTIVFTVFFYGTVEPWSIAVFELLIILILFLWAAKSVFSKKFELRIPPTSLPIAAFLLLGLAQSIAWTNDGGQISSISYDVEATRSAVKILFFLFISHLIAANFFVSKERIRFLINFLTVLGLILSVYSFIQYFALNGGIFRGGLTAPFVNHNHIAGYLELLLPLPVALLLMGVSRHLRILYGFAVVMIGVAIIGSLSRGGMISAGAGLIFLSIAVFVYRRRSQTANKIRETNDETLPPFVSRSSVSKLAPFVLVLSVIILGALWIGSDTIVSRMTDNSLFRDDEKAQSFDYIRGWIWKNAITIFQDNPVFGTGMGTFETVYPNYSDIHNIPETVNQAHNDYLQVLSDTGLIGGAIVLWFIGVVFLTIRRVFRLEDPLLFALGIGCAAALCSMMIHSIFDFNLQLPATALLFLILTAILTNISSLADNHPKKG